jgi:hypothetical protein
VVSPLDAIRSYACSGIDALLMDNFLLTKFPLASASAPARETQSSSTVLSRISA